MTTPLGFAVALMFIGLASGLLDVIMNARVSMLESQTGKTVMNANHAMFSVGYASATMIVAATREAGVPPGPVFAGFAMFCWLLVPFVWMPVTDFVPDEDAASARYPF